MRPKWALACVALLLAGIAVANSATAYNRAALAPRSVGTTIVVDASSYVGISGTACTVSRLTGGSCSFTLSNKSPKSLTFTASEAAGGDPSGRASGPTVSPSTAVAPGSTASVSTTITGCGLGCSVGSTYTVTYSIGATSSPSAGKEILVMSKAAVPFVVTWST